MVLMAVYCTHAVLMGAAVLVAGRRRVQWILSAICLCFCFLLEWFAPVGSLSRAIMALGGVAALAGTITVAVSSIPRWSIGFRLLQIITFGYRIHAGRIRPVLSIRILGRLLVEATAIGTAWLLLRYFIDAPLSITVRASCRLLAGIVFIYAIAEFIADLIHFSFLASGTAMRPIHITPIAARSLRNFWGKRWNRAVSGWLRRFIFSPLANRRRPKLGLICAFLVSAAMHAWLLLVAVGASAALSMATFFCLQGMFILAEDRFQVRGWLVPLGRVWTLTILLATSPLFICPFLSLLHL